MDPQLAARPLPRPAAQPPMDLPPAAQPVTDPRPAAQPSTDPRLAARPTPRPAPPPPTAPRPAARPVTDPRPRDPQPRVQPTPLDLPLGARPVTDPRASAKGARLPKADRPHLLQRAERSHSRLRRPPWRLSEWTFGSTGDDLYCLTSSTRRLRARPLSDSLADTGA